MGGVVWGDGPTIREVGGVAWGDGPMQSILWAGRRGASGYNGPPAMAPSLLVPSAIT